MRGRVRSRRPLGIDATSYPARIAGAPLTSMDWPVLKRIDRSVHHGVSENVTPLQLLPQLAYERSKRG